MKRLLVLLVVCALCQGGLAFANQDEGFTYEPMSVSGSAPSLVGEWAIAGEASVSASFPGALNLRLTLPKVGLFGETFAFDAAGNFSEPLLGMRGTYRLENTGFFTIDLSDWISSLEAELEELLSSYDISATLEVTKQVFTGKVTSATKFTGKFSVIVKVHAASPYAGKVTISGNVNGKKLSSPQANIAEPPQTLESLAKILVERFILPALGVLAR